MSIHYHEKYIAQRKALIRVICRTKQWSGLDESDVFNWLDNFKDTFGKYIATKLLIHSVYYSEKNIMSLLHFGIKELILSTIIKQDLVKNDKILLHRSETNAMLNHLLSKSVFVPLSDNKKPGESANQMTRYLIQKIDIEPSQTFFIEDLHENKVKDLSALIFIDDCIGSGDQFISFINSYKVKSKVEISIKNKIPVYYLILTGYKKNIKILKAHPSLKGVEIIACDELDDNDKVFNRKHIIWYDDEEYEKAHQYFDGLEKEYGINKYGHSNLDFSVFIHNTVPDWSLPIYWMENSDWKPLLKRKYSNLF